MNIPKLILLNTWRLRARYIVLAVVLFIGAGLVAVGATLGTYAGTGGSSALDQQDALRRIDVYADAQTGTINEAALVRIRSAAGVASAAPVIQADVGWRETGSLFRLTNLRPGAGIPVTAGSEGAALKDGNVMIPDRIEGRDLDAFLGKQIDLSYTAGITKSSGRGVDGRFTVAGLYSSSWQVDGPLAAYCSLDCVVRIAAARAGVPANQYADLVGFDRAVVVAQREQDVEAVTAALQAQGFRAVSVQQELASVPGVISVIRLVTGALFVVLMVMALITAIGMAQALARQRVGEAAVLQTVGWSPRRILALLLGEAGVLAAVSVACGIGVGILSGRYIGSLLGDSAGLGEVLSNPGIPPLHWLALGWLAAVVLVVAGAWLPLRRTAKIDVVRSLVQV